MVVADGLRLPLGKPIAIITKSVIDKKRKRPLPRHSLSLSLYRGDHICWQQHPNEMIIACNDSSVVKLARVRKPAIKHRRHRSSLKRDNLSEKVFRFDNGLWGARSLFQRVAQCVPRCSTA